ncbi:MAG: Chemotaxis response regulator protein-glutamate methylesterase [Anaerolineae bacterium]|nr:Chemotaxis response regulator protein-glutamate methylesterase [Anaerolineae bacterium]
MVNDNKILLVDDDAYVLHSYQRILKDLFVLETASGGPEGLSIIETAGPFAVVVADMRMPEMDGIEFLTRVKDVAPNTVRMMLTGNADMLTAIEAVNKGNIYRFLTKPCPVQQFIEAMQAGIKQYQLVTAERELLEGTLNGSIKVLIEVLSLASPIAFGRANRLAKLVGHMAARLNVPDPWQYKLAALLSQIGCITLPPGVLEKVNAQIPLEPAEKNMYDVHPTVGHQLLAHIPRLKIISRMIERQHQPAAQPVLPKDLTSEEVLVLFGGQLLKIALDFNELLMHGANYHDALAVLKKRADTYNPHLLAVLGQHAEPAFETEAQTSAGPQALRVQDLKTGFIVKQDVWSKSGLLLVQKEQEVTLPVLMRLRNFAQGIGVEEPILVQRPA